MGNQQVSTSEIYKEHPEYPEILVSNYGNIKTSSTGKPRYTNINKQGYPVIQIKRNGKVKSLKIHRLVAELFLPPPPKEMVDKCKREHWKVVLVKHLDNDKTNNFYENLEWSDLRGNTKQAWDDGLIEGLQGSKNGRSVLTEDRVHELCRFFELGNGPKAAVEKFGCSRQQASKIRAGFAWKHISDQYDIKPLR